jgi:hypothetical protein
VTWRDPLPVEELLKEDGLYGDMLTARHTTEARARDPVPLVIMITRRVTVDRGHHSDIRRIESRDVRLAIANTRIMFTSDLAIHVHTNQDRLTGLLRHSEGVIPCALPLDQARLRPVVFGGCVPHLLTTDTVDLERLRGAREESEREEIGETRHAR